MISSNPALRMLQVSQPRAHVADSGAPTTVMVTSTEASVIATTLGPCPPLASFDPQTGIKTSNSLTFHSWLSEARAKLTNCNRLVGIFTEVPAATDTNVADIASIKTMALEIMRLVLADHHQDAFPLGHKISAFHALQHVMKKFNTSPDGSKSSGELKSELALIKMTEPTTFMEIEPNFRLFITVLESKRNEINHILNPKDEEAHRHRTVSQNDLIVHLFNGAPLFKPVLQKLSKTQSSTHYDDYKLACFRIFTESENTREIAEKLKLKDRPELSSLHNSFPHMKNSNSSNQPLVALTEDTSALTANYVPTAAPPQTFRPFSNRGPYRRPHFHKPRFAGRFNHSGRSHFNRDNTRSTYNSFSRHGNTHGQRYSNGPPNHSGTPMSNNHYQPRFPNQSFQHSREGSQRTWNPTHQQGRGRFGRGGRFNHNFTPRRESVVNFTDSNPPTTQFQHPPRMGTPIQDLSDTYLTMTTDSFPAISLTTQAVDPRDFFIVDSGSSHTHVNTYSTLTDIDQSPHKQLQVSTASGHQLTTSGLGKIGLSDIKAYFTPQFTASLLSVSQLSDMGYGFTFTANSCSIFNETDDIRINGIRFGNLYLIKKDLLQHISKISSSPIIKDGTEGELFSPPLTIPAALAVKEPLSNFLTWHQRTHLARDTLIKLAKHQFVHGLNLRVTDLDNRLSACPHCAIAKTRRHSYRRSRTKLSHKDLLQLIYTDVKGPLHPKSIIGEQYVVSFICAKSKYAWVYTLKSKSAVSDALVTFHNTVLTAIRRHDDDHRISFNVISSDGGGEYAGQFERHCATFGYRHDVIPPYTPELNGVAENYWRTLFGLVRCMLSNASDSVHISMWNHAVRYANFILNRFRLIPNNDVLKTPYEWLFGQPPEVSHIRTFGSTCYIFMPKEKRTNTSLQSHAVKATFIGFRDDKPENQKAREVIAFTATANNIISLIERQDYNNTTFDEIIEARTHIDSGVEVTSQVLDLNLQTQVDNLVNKKRKLLETWQNPAPVPPVWSDRHLPAISRAALAQAEKTTFSLKEVRNRPDWSRWLEAAKEELISMQLQDVFEIVPRPTHKLPLSTLWVFKIKIDTLGNISKYKGRLTVKGCQAVLGIDYLDTFSPVAKMPAVRIFLSLVTQYSLKTAQFDVPTAFLKANLEDEIFIELPELFDVVHNDIDTSQVLKLKKAVYGLPQSPRSWYKAADKAIRQLGYLPIPSEPCIYKLDNRLSFLALYVDDMVLAAEQDEEVERVTAYLKSVFNITVCSNLQSFLGLHIERNPLTGTTTISQKAKISDLNQRAIAYLSTRATVIAVERMRASAVYPFKSSTQLHANPERGLPPSKAQREQLSAQEHSLYRSLVGSLMHIANASRPDISFASSVFARFLSLPKRTHLHAVIHCIFYLSNNADKVISYSRPMNVNAPLDIDAFSDSDWGANIDSRKSQSGCIFYLGGNLIHWASTQQSIVALSTAEAEVYALKETVKSLIWLRSIIQSILPYNPQPTVFCDNEAAILMVTEPVISKQNRHFDMSYLFIKETIQKRNVRYVPSKTNVADICTKIIVSDIFHQLLSKALTNS